jgi:hypothetical protein
VVRLRVPAARSSHQQAGVGDRRQTVIDCAVSSTTLHRSDVLTAGTSRAAHPFQSPPAHDLLTSAAAAAGRRGDNGGLSQIDGDKQHALTQSVARTPHLAHAGLLACAEIHAHLVLASTRMCSGATTDDRSASLCWPEQCNSISAQVILRARLWWSRWDGLDETCTSDAC